jgi:hypothetical protein
MTRTAYAARTAYDLKRLNHIRVPEFWIVKLNIALGAKCSKSYLTSDAPNQGASSGTGDFHFAPENESPSIDYEIDDPFGMIASAKLEVFTRFRDQALWTVNLKKIGEDTYTHGKHTLKWDGRLVKNPDQAQAGTESDGAVGHDLTALDPDKTSQPDFPDGYFTLQYTPYKLKLTVSDQDDVEAAGTIRVAWTYFQILLKKLELELGPEKSLPKAAAGKPDLDLQVYKDTDPESLNGKLPAAAAAQASKVILTSNIFKNSNAQMHDRTDFQAYQTLWGDGPNIPVFAKAWIADSGDNAVECPKALGKVKFLWDAQDVPESSGSVYAGHYAEAKTFIDNGVNYDKDTTKPKGDNCHKDRGGKRGDAAKACFPEQKGYGYGYGGNFDGDPQQDTLQDRQFPFKVEACQVRKWSSYSYAWTKGVLKSKTGVLFQPCRMGGDAYKVSVYLAYDRKCEGAKESIILDSDPGDPLTKTNPILKAATGIFEMWRRLNFVKYMKKHATVTPTFHVNTFQNYYKQAYVKVDYSGGDPVVMAKADFDSAAATVINAENWYTKLMYSTGSQYDAGDHGLDFLTWAAWKTAVQTAKGWSNANLATFLGTVLNTEAKYNAFCSNIAASDLSTVCESFMDPADGINLFQFNEHYNLATSVGGQTLNGFAPGAAVGPKKTDPTNTQCLFVLCAGTGNYGGDSNTPEQTVTHEIGHCLFMAHAPVQTATDIANKHDATVHDKNFNNCTMSYHYDAERKWCGFCLFRLRGWDRAQLKNDAVQNKKP